MRGLRNNTDESRLGLRSPSVVTFLALIVFLGVPALAQDTPSPPASFRAFDKPNDSGNRIMLEWTKSPDDGGGSNVVSGYDLYRSESPDGPFEKLTAQPMTRGDGSYEDRQDRAIGGHKVKNKTTYYYQIRALTGAGSKSQPAVASAAASWTFFDVSKLNTLLPILIYVAILLGMIFTARSGRKMFIRRLAGIDAIEEAVGRATEMGKPVLYVPGMHDLAEVNTIAAVNILSGVAKKVGQYQSRLLVPCRDPMVMTVAQEVVKEAYTSIGRPDAYDSHDIFYTTYDQFPYVASVDGIMMREKPATNLYMGYYYAESLILAETGALTGAIQIAGTDAVTQLPFFVTACDYTLIGEELYAASAYISEDPMLLGSLKGQDYMKFLLAVVMAIGIVATTIYGIKPEWQFLSDIVALFKPVASG